jgi:hypothetical protein
VSQRRTGLTKQSLPRRIHGMSLRKEIRVSESAKQEIRRIENAHANLTGRSKQILME